MLNRREFLKSASLIALAGGCVPLPVRRSSVFANDIHSQLNETALDRIVAITSTDEIRRAIADARREGKSVSIAGGRHAMGGQQFGHGTINLDMRSFDRIVSFDRTRGLVEVESGIQWPKLVDSLVQSQADSIEQWGISQKQTGADRLTIGGAVAANIHGRGLTLPPFVNDIEELTLIDANGEAHRCNRQSNQELFALVVGGYGLFGVVATVKLRLRPRIKVERVVEIRSIDGLMSAMAERIAAGYLYGDFQFSIDERSEKFLREGVFSCYRPADPAIRIATRELSESDWSRLITLAHDDKAAAYETYTKYYLSTTGQVYWSDTHQLSVYLDDYHRAIDARSGKRGTEIITEIYVPRPRLADFMEEARSDFLRNGVNVFYGTIRLIEEDRESFLAWAKQPYACVIFNLHTEHSPFGAQHSADAFRRLIDMAARRDGSYYLTYHRNARRDQVERCYPQFAQFIRRKRDIDPRERFQSDWYRHYRNLFAA